MSVLLRQGNLVYPRPRGVERADLLIEGEKISRVEKRIDTASLPPETRIVDASPYLVFPGFIDAHTHYGVGEGEGRSADGWYEGTAAAAYGGITTCIDFSDQIPGLSLAKGAELRIREAEGDALVDFALHQGLYRLHDKIPQELEGLKVAGVSAVKIFSTYKHLGLYLDPEGWNTLFPLCREKELLLTIHAEDEEILEAAASKYPGDGLGPEMHPILRPSRAEAAAVLAAGRRDRHAPLHSSRLLEGDPGGHRAAAVRGSAGCRRDRPPLPLPHRREASWGGGLQVYHDTPPAQRWG